jgi:glycosyltransferase involved in cell wall biosynthesis
MKKVCFLTDMYVDMAAYSLQIILRGQLRMLLNAGYSPIVIADEGFKGKEEGIWTEVEMRYLPPPKERKNDVEFYPELQDDIVKIGRGLKTALEGVDVVITHDMIYQSSMLPYNYAARLWAENHTDVQWLNWVHSATPSPVWTKQDTRLEPLQRHFPNSLTVYPNHWDTPRVQRSYKCQPHEVAVVPHFTDLPTYWGFQDITKKLIAEKELMSADVILVYPIRLDRGKQVEYVIRTAAGIKEFGRTVRAVIVDFHSTGGDKVTYRDELKVLQADLKLTSDDVIFTSEFDKSLELEAPREVVADLMHLCTAFVLPSVSETYSLIAQEAAASGALLVLNFDFPPFRSIYGENAIYCKFSSAIDVMTGETGRTDTKYNDIDEYFRGVAGGILYEVSTNKVLAQRVRIRKERGLDYVFKQFMEPLFYSKTG